MNYFNSPLTTIDYHLTQMSFFLGTLVILIIIYQTNRKALQAKQNPLALIPLPSLPRRRRGWKNKARYLLARLLLAVGAIRIPRQITVVSSWKPAGATGAARRRA